MVPLPIPTLLLQSHLPHVVYTFDFFQHVFNLATMKIDVGVTTIDVLQIIGKAPVQIMSVHWDPVTNPKGIEECAREGKKLGYLYNVEVWHERAFPKREVKEEEVSMSENESERLHPHHLD
jgi:hypothetical protein